MSDSTWAGVVPLLWLKNARKEIDTQREEIERLGARVAELETAIEYKDDAVGRDALRWNELIDQLAECRRLLRGLLLASECFMSSEVVDETSGTIPLMDRLSRAIDAARVAAGGE